MKYTKAEIENEIEEFVLNEDEDELTFPASLTKY